MREAARQRRLKTIQVLGLPCSGCGAVVPYRLFHRSSKRWTGVESRCKSCSSVSGKKYSDANVVRNAQKGPSFTDKKCSRCGGIKPRSGFTSNVRMADGVSNWCADCDSQKGRRYYASAKPEVRRRVAEYRKANAERLKAASRDWDRNNREKRRSHGRTRRYRKKAAFVEDVDDWVVSVLCDWECGICGLVVDPADFHLDHCVPIARGGKHSFTNVQIAHPFCNISKRDRYSNDWKHPAWGVFIYTAPQERA